LQGRTTKHREAGSVAHAGRTPRGIADARSLNRPARQRQTASGPGC